MLVSHLKYFVAPVTAVALLTSCAGGSSTPAAAGESLAPSLRSQPILGRNQRARPFSTETVIHSFAGPPTDGSSPYGDLIDVDGMLYGTSAFGGTHSRHGAGTVFSVTTSGVETVLYNFAPSARGYQPQSGLTVMGPALYGTTYNGGANYGTIFRINLADSNAFHHLYSFTGSPTDGAMPEYGSLTKVGSTLYGTTTEGGQTGDGTVFMITKTGTETVLHSFLGGSDGAYPNSDLTYVHGTLYGTTRNGGTGTCSAGCGTVFSITPSGTETVLYSFVGQAHGRDDGANPGAGLIPIGGNLYGTTMAGGGLNDGTVFKIGMVNAIERELHSFGGGIGGTDGKLPEATLTDVNGTLYGTTLEGGNSGCVGGSCGTIFSIGKTEGKYSQLYSFSGGTDGGNPQGALLDVGGTFYGLTTSGGTGACSEGCGTVYSFTP
ncbi:MAG: choice-of-anchor tandem repeat GloVer-containing protein [Candidatus Tumulicola sp.]